MLYKVLYWLYILYLCRIFYYVSIIYLYVDCFLVLLYISIFTLFDFEFVG